MSICPGGESQLCHRVHRSTVRCCASWHTLGTPGDASPRASQIDLSADPRSGATPLIGSTGLWHVRQWVFENGVKVFVKWSC